ncbi:MAG: hypothetical protein JWM47_2975 [Acidimicrobiales bacterium]|nr:hypothetical protein [Acidimicrobiales bacterium]
MDLTAEQARFEDVPLGWRLLDARDNVLPDEVLAWITILGAVEAARAWSDGVTPNGARSTLLDARGNDGGDRLLTDWDDPEGGRELLRAGVQIAPDRRLALLWGPTCGVSLLWDDFTRYWDDFCYPSDDHVVLLAPEDGIHLSHCDERWIVRRVAAGR